MTEALAKITELAAQVERQRLRIEAGGVHAILYHPLGLGTTEAVFLAVCATSADAAARIAKAKADGRTGSFTTIATEIWRPE